MEKDGLGSLDVTEAFESEFVVVNEERVGGWPRWFFLNGLRFVMSLALR